MILVRTWHGMTARTSSLEMVATMVKLRVSFRSAPVVTCLIKSANTLIDFHNIHGQRDFIKIMRLAIACAVLRTCVSGLSFVQSCGTHIYVIGSRGTQRDRSAHPCK